MSEAVLEGVERDLLPGVAEVGLSVAGEPFLTPDLPQLVDRLTAHGARLEVTTNGTLVEEGPLLRKVLNAASLLRFSVDGATQMTYGSIRPGARLERVLDGVRAAVRTRRGGRPRITLCTVIQRRNVQDLPTLVDLAHDLGVDRLEVSLLTPLWPDQEDERADPVHVRSACMDARRRADALRLRLLLPRSMGRPSWATELGLLRREVRRVDLGILRRRVRHGASLAAWSARVGGRVPCAFLQGMAWVSLGGDVSCCCQPGRPVGGNLLDQPFERIWNGPVLTGLRRAFLAGEPLACCRGCGVNPTR